jgi:tetratricopeptide (TPR) repeat protein
LRRLGHAQEARLAALHGLDRLVGHPKQSTTAELLITLANSTADLGRHEEALTALDEAQAIFTQLHNTHGIHQSMICRSRSLIGLERRDEARRILLSILESDDLSLIVESQAISNLAVVEEHDNPTIARNLLERDLEIHGRLNDDFGRAATLINLALLELDQGDSAKARVLLTSAREAASRAKAGDLVARVSRLLQQASG